MFGLSYVLLCFLDLVIHTQNGWVKCFTEIPRSRYIGKIGVHGSPQFFYENYVQRQYEFECDPLAEK